MRVDSECSISVFVEIQLKNNLHMKWSQFVVEQGEDVRPVSPISHLNVSRSNSSLNNQKRFTLKSVEKAALNVSKNESKNSRVRQEDSSGDQALKKMMSKISFKSNNFSRLRDQNSVDRNSSKHIDKEAYMLAQVCEAFLKQFQTFIETFFSRYQEQKPRLVHQQLLQNKILQGVRDSLSSFFKTKEHLVFKSDSPLKKNTLQTQRSGVSSEQSPTLQKKFSRAIQFKNQKIIQKDLYNNQSQQNRAELEKLVSKIKSQETNGKKKFSRTGSRSKRDKSNDSSLQEIVERSFNDSHRSSRSKLQARQAIYKFNQVFSQNNHL